MEILKKKHVVNYGVLTLFTILFITFFRLWSISTLPLSADEAYFWVCSRHPALSFYDTPPLVPYMIFLSTRLFGNTEFAVRFFVSLFMAVAACIMYLLGIEVSEGDKKSGFFSALLLLVIPGFSIAGILSGVEAPLLLFYLLSIYFLFRAVIRQQFVYWYLAGLSMGLGFLSKYLILFLPLSLFLYLTLTENRRYLKTRYPYLFILIGLLVSSPVIVWNAQNQWANFLLNFFYRTRSSFTLSPNGMNFIKLLGAETAILSPFILILFIYGFFRIFFDARKNRKMLFLFFFSWPILIFFILYSLFLEVPAPHWLGIGYLTLIAGLPYLVFKSAYRKGIRIFFAVSVITGIAMTSFIHLIPYAHDSFLKLPVDESTKKDFESFLNDYPVRLGEKLGEIYNNLPDKNNYFLIGRGFATASYLEFYNPGQKEVYMIFQMSKLGHGYYFWQDINENTGKNAIFVDTSPRYEDKLKSLFKKIERMSDYHIYSENGRYLDSAVFYNCLEFKGMEKEKPPVLR
jgi:hypothetical protein